MTYSSLILLQSYTIRNHEKNNFFVDALLFNLQIVERTKTPELITFLKIKTFEIKVCSLYIKPFVLRSTFAFVFQLNK